MAQTVHLFLKIGGNDVKGESRQTSEGREGSIECSYFEGDVVTAREQGSGLSTGRRAFKPLVIRKAIDKSSPLLLKALSKNQTVDGVFKFYRPNPSGDGTTEQFYTVEFKNGRVAAVKQMVQFTEAGSDRDVPPMEEVQFVFSEIIWRYEQGGVEHTDNWAQN
jgi:type VI secretion system secreted protein Hcp